jgi:hypothetical protein
MKLRSKKLKELASLVRNGRLFDVQAWLQSGKPSRSTARTKANPVLESLQTGFHSLAISIWTGISVALIEILVGVAAGNLLHLRANTEWINFLALLGANFSSPGQRGDSRDLSYYPPSFFGETFKGRYRMFTRNSGFQTPGS